MTTTFTQQIEASFAPWLAHDPQNALLNVLAALAQMGEQVYGIVADQGSPDDPANYTAGWSVLLDPDNCPAQFISYGAQFVGVQIPPSTGETDARAIWKEEAGFSRGTPAAIIAAARRYLTGTKSAILLERQGSSGPLSAYEFVLQVKPAEVVSVTQLTAAVDAARPAGITWALVQTAGTTWASETHTWTADTQTWAQKG